MVTLRLELAEGATTLSYDKGNRWGYWNPESWLTWRKLRGPIRWELERERGTAPNGHVV